MEIVNDQLKISEAIRVAMAFAGPGWRAVGVVRARARGPVCVHLSADCDTSAQFQSGTSAHVAIPRELAEAIVGEASPLNSDQPSWWLPAR